ncbi:probable 2-oxoglutarate-dependent dioxygenase At5g05600 isoform X1 [Camellia sinensis]|uniref:probable 2-oxoglutarate-dependent dioxygenase At5g05600 isoform X1 n=1 Tax=Camellia sinensis TaxID=4442 RepID=UPI00103596FF|nr:probable 2-oxoglutarate-dependent dioxygenase At5g05600 isoform X1 [Camellia sinensis]
MEESKATTTKDNNIPLIDLSLLNSPNNFSSADSIASLAAEITEACETWGCFQVINHGVPVEQSRAIESASRQFFDQPKEEKKKVWRYERNPLGYHDSEITMNVRDWKEVFDFTVQNPTLFPASPDPHDLELRELVNQWPQFPPQFREVCEEYAKEIEKLGYQLLELLSLSLGLPRRRLNHFFKDQTSIVRFNHYPPCPNHPGQVLGVGQHTDSGALSILAQDDVGGLQVKRKWDGKWVPVKPNPHAYLVIICDIFQHPMLILKKVIWCLFVLFMLVENVLPQSDAEMLFNYETENLGTELQRLPATLIESVEALQKDNLLGNLVSEIFQKLKYKFGRRRLITIPRIRMHTSSNLIVPSC